MAIQPNDEWTPERLVRFEEWKRRTTDRKDRLREITRFIADTQTMPATPHYTEPRGEYQMPEELKLYNGKNGDPYMTDLRGDEHASEAKFIRQVLGAIGLGLLMCILLSAALAAT